MVSLISDLTAASAGARPEAEALKAGSASCTYAELERGVQRFAGSLLGFGLAAQERVALYADKSIDLVTAMFGTCRAGGVMVPVNPLLKAEQVGYILRDCNVAVLVTTEQRLATLALVLPQCHDLRLVVVLNSEAPESTLGRWHRRAVVPCVHQRRRAAAPASRDRCRHGGHPLYLRQHRPAEGRGAVASQHDGRRAKRRAVSREPTGRPHPRGPAAVVRLRVVAADHRVSQRRHRGAAQLPARQRCAARAWLASGSPGSPPCRRCGMQLAALDLARSDRPAPALFHQLRRRECRRRRSPRCASARRRRGRT